MKPSPASAPDAAIALFGGSFNPPHLGHLGVCRHVLDAHPGELWLVPAYRHPFGKRLSSFEDRVRMSEGLVHELAARTGRVRVSRVEEEVHGQRGWTIDLLRHLVALHPDARFRLVLGSDLLEERDRWKDFDEIERLAPPIWVPRRGFDEANRSLEREPFLADIRSVDIRARVARGEPIESYVGAAVASYIREHGLYREGT